MADPFMQDAVRWQPYCVFDPLDYEKLINFGIGETRVGPEINARDLPLVAFDNRLQHTVPSVGGVDVAGTKRTSFQVTELVEHEELRNCATPCRRRSSASPDHDAGARHRSHP